MVHWPDGAASAKQSDVLSGGYSERSKSRFKAELSVGCEAIAHLAECFNAARSAHQKGPCQAMSGGVLWCSGNCLTVYIIKQIGLGPGA